jgi:L-rhamnose mutarotase
MQKVCFQLRLKKDRIAEYRKRHAEVWPDMLREIAASGRHNYSLFLNPDGLVIGYFETESLEASQAYLDASEVAGRWEKEAAAFFEDLGDVRPDQGTVLLPEIFNLEEQLLAANGD